MRPSPTESTHVLRGRRILVTGVSRPMGIGYGISRQCARAGATVLTAGYARYDAEQGYPDAGDTSEALVRRLAEEGLDVHALPDEDLSQAEAPGRLLRHARRRVDFVDGLVLNHAYSVSEAPGAWTATTIDHHLMVNVRASMLLLQEFAAQLPEDRGGSVVLMTSGQYLGRMVEEIAYAVSKEAIRGLCAQAAAAFSRRGVRVNCVNPGPTDTGYLAGEAWERVRRMFPAGRWGTADDVARLVIFLLGDSAQWITGQTIASEGGFERT